MKNPLGKKPIEPTFDPTAHGVKLPEADLEPELPKSDPWAPTDGTYSLPDVNDNGKLTPTEAEQMGLKEPDEEADDTALRDEVKAALDEEEARQDRPSEFYLGPDNPDEGDHQSKLDNLDTSLTASGLQSAPLHSLGAPDEEYPSDLKIVHNDLPKVNPHPMAAAAKFLFGDSEEDIARSQAAEAKRQANLEKLRGLGQEALDRIYDEYVFNNDPRFAALNELAKGDPNADPSDEEVASAMSLMKNLSPGVMVEFITGSLKYSADRVAAISKYNDYRSMLEDFS